MLATNQTEAPTFADSHYEQSKHSRYYLIEPKNPVAFRAYGALEIVSLDATYSKL